MDKQMDYHFHGQTIIINHFRLLYKCSNAIVDDYSPLSVFPRKQTSEIIEKLHPSMYETLEKYGHPNEYFLTHFQASDNFVSLVALVHCNQNYKVVIEADLPGYSKLWINRKLEYICVARQKKEFFSLRLYRGWNTVIIEYQKSMTSPFPPYIYIQVYPYRRFINKRLFPVNTKTLLRKQARLAGLYNEHSGTLQLVIYGSSHFLPGKVSKIRISGRKINRMIMCKSQKIVEIPYRLLLTEADHVTASVGREKSTIMINIPNDWRNQIIDQANRFAQTADQQKRGELLGRIQKIQNPFTFIEDQYRLLNELSLIMSHEKVNVGSSQIKRVYYLSTVDLTYQEVCCILPKDYDSRKKYPLILNLSISEFDYLQFTSNRFIVANCNGRGVLGGSYLSEVCSFEALNQVKTHFPTDDQRIYLIGKSNGGYAVWSILQNRPGIFAAAYPISGFPNLHNILNVTNTPIQNYVSTEDSCYKYQSSSLLECLYGFPNYVQCAAPKQIHHAFSEFYWFSFFAFFYQKKLDAYPRNIFFRTERNRYLTSYWIRLHGISFGHRWAYCHAIANTKQIIIFAENTPGITITIPPYVNRSAFLLITRNQTFPFSDYHESQISIQFENDKASVTRREDITMFTNKGTGLLDVYMDGLTIITSPAAEAIRVAKNFAQPHTNGYFSPLQVSYPIIELPQLRTVPIRNLILVDISTADISERFCIDLSNFIYPSESGWWYKQQFFAGKYCCLQCIPHPQDRSKSILLINSVGKKISGSIFTRKVILPFMTAGINEYWNNAALILHDKSIYRIYEWGADIECILEV